MKKKLRRGEIQDVFSSLRGGRVGINSRGCGRDHGEDSCWYWGEEKKVEVDGVDTHPHGEERQGRRV